jgi:hypothetical protein
MSGVVQLPGTKHGILLLSKRIQFTSITLINNFMSEKTHSNNDTEDELNQARFFAERGAQVDDVEEPSEDGPMFDEEDISALKSEYREQPAKADHESKIADESPFYGQGFGSGDDDGIRRMPAPTEKGDRDSLGG